MKALSFLCLFIMSICMGSLSSCSDDMKDESSTINLAPFSIESRPVTVNAASTSDGYSSFVINDTATIGDAELGVLLSYKPMRVFFKAESVILSINSNSSGTIKNLKMSTAKMTTNYQGEENEEYEINKEYTAPDLKLYSVHTVNQLMRNDSVFIKVSGMVKVPEKTELSYKLQFKGATVTGDFSSITN